MYSSSYSHPLRALFAGITEHTFLTELGMADTRLTDYLTGMLVRFIHRDDIFAIKSSSNQPLEEVTEMMVEAERSETTPESRRQIFRHIGDFTLFWTGLYPEAIQRRRKGADALLSYEQQGKRSYYLASTYSDTQDQAEEAPVLRCLSDQFDLCVFGLRKVRSHWDTKMTLRDDAASAGDETPPNIN